MARSHQISFVARFNFDQVNFYYQVIYNLDCTFLHFASPKFRNLGCDRLAFCPLEAMASWNRRQFEVCRAHEVA